jgi:hypothetical protein
MLQLPKSLIYLVATLLLAACTFVPITPEAPADTSATEAAPAETPAAEEEAAGEATAEATEEATAEATEEAVEEATAEATEEATEEAMEEAADFSSPFDDDILMNLEYTMEGVGDGPVQLTDGVYEDSANRIIVNWIDTYALGDLNDEPVAAVVLVANTGGSGTFSYLNLVVERDGEPVNIASTLLGDRVTMNWVTIANNEIELDLVTQGPDEPMCCATQRTFVVYEWDGEALVNLDATVIGVQQQLTETTVITYVPEIVPDVSEPGSCFSNAIGLGRADAWRCTTEDNLIHDPCFEVSDETASDGVTIVCGADPIIGETGFALELTEPLPAPEPGTAPGAWLVQLGDGTVCGLLTGTVAGGEDWIAPYACADDADSVLTDQIFEAGPVLFAQRADVDLTDAGFVVVSSVRTPVATIWR